MQNTREEVVTNLGPADIDNRDILEGIAEEVNHALVRVVLQRMEGFVDHYPARLAQQEPREDQALLLVISEFPVPPRDAIERGG